MIDFLNVTQSHSIVCHLLIAYYLYIVIFNRTLQVAAVCSTLFLSLLKKNWINWRLKKSVPLFKYFIIKKQQSAWAQSFGEYFGNF